MPTYKSVETGNNFESAKIAKGNFKFNGSGNDFKVPGQTDP